jgi:hypothetical protein
MTETLKSLRGLHSALGIVMAAIILIGITSSQVRKYEQALEELQNLKKLPWQDYAEFCLTILRRDFEPRYIEETRSDYVSVFKDKYKIKMKEPFEVALLPIVLVPPEGSTLATYRNFLSDSDEIGYYRPGRAEDVASIVVTDFDNPKKQPDWFSPESTIDFVQSELFTKSHDIRTLKLPSEAVVLTKLLLPNQLDAITRLYYITPPSNIVKERIATAKVIPLTTTAAFARQWLQSSQSALLAQPSKNSSGSLLPQTSRFAGELDTMTIDEAISFVTRKAKENEQSFSFLGQSFAGSIVGLIGPSFIAAILLLLISYQRNLARANSATELDEIKKFPWLGLFNDRMSRVLFIVSVAVIPTACVLICLLLLTDFWTSQFYYTAAVLCLVGAMSAVMVRENKRLLAFLRDQVAISK